MIWGKKKKLTGWVNSQDSVSMILNPYRGKKFIDYTALDDVLMAKVKSLFNKLYKKGDKVGY